MKKKYRQHIDIKKPIFSNVAIPFHLRFWCQTVLPLVYEDSLSYYELLCKVVHYINHLIEDDKNILKNFDLLKEYVFTYFEYYQNRGLIVYEDLVTNDNYTDILTDVNTIETINVIYRIDTTAIPLIEHLPISENDYICTLFNFDNFNLYYDEEEGIYTESDEKYGNIQVLFTVNDIWFRYQKDDGSWSSWVSFLEEIREEISDLKNRMTEAENTIRSHTQTLANHETRITNNETNISSLTQRITTAEGDIDSLEDRMSTAENDIDSLENRVSTNETNIATNADNIAQNTTNITNLTTRVSTAENDIDNLENRVSINETNIATNAGNISQNTTNITNLTGRVSTAESDIDSLENSVATNTGNIATNAGEIQGIKDGYIPNVGNVKNGNFTLERETINIESSNGNTSIYSTQDLILEGDVNAKMIKGNNASVEIDNNSNTTIKGVNTTIKTADGSSEIILKPDEIDINTIDLNCDIDGAKLVGWNDGILEVNSENIELNTTLKTDVAQAQSDITALQNAIGGLSSSVHSMIAKDWLDNSNNTNMIDCNTSAIAKNTALNVNDILIISCPHERFYRVQSGYNWQFRYITKDNVSSVFDILNWGNIYDTLSHYIAWDTQPLFLIIQIRNIGNPQNAVCLGAISYDSMKAFTELDLLKRYNAKAVYYTGKTDDTTNNITYLEVENPIYDLTTDTPNLSQINVNFALVYTATFNTIANDYPNNAVYLRYYYSASNYRDIELLNNDGNAILCSDIPSFKHGLSILIDNGKGKVFV